MKTIGLIGGMSWESTVPYYTIINERTMRKLGSAHSARILMSSVDFGELEPILRRGEWHHLADILGEEAARLERAGADFVLVCTNTMHKVADEIQSHVRIPLVHIADVTADALAAGGVRKVALLGTKYTMTEDFYRERLVRRGFEVLIPDEADVEFVNRVIFEELCVGVKRADSRSGYARIIADLKARGAEAVIFGCTEIGLLVSASDAVLPIYDTTVIHAVKAAELALS